MPLITTTADLISSIDKRAFVPTSQLTFTDPDKLALANEELETWILPVIYQLREEYYVYCTDTALVAAQGSYDIPPRSFGLTVREVHLINASGDIVRNLEMVDANEICDYRSGEPNAFYLKNNKIVLDRTPNAANSRSLRIWYALRPAKFVETSEAAQVASFDAGAGTITVGTIPSAWATGDAFDISRQDGGLEPLALDSVSTLVSGSTITLSSIPSDLRVGDWVSINDETPLCFMPPEFRQVLAQFVAARMKRSLKTEDAKDATKTAEMMLESLRKSLEPRMAGARKFVSSSVWG